MDAVPLLQVGSAFLLNVAFAWLVGSICARYWLQSGGVPPGRLHATLCRLDHAAAGAGVLGCLAALWAATAVMSGLPLGEAQGMLWTMLSSTDYGRAGGVALVAMLLAPVIRLVGGRAGNVLLLGTLIVFAMTRASMGHAGEAGLLSAIYAAEAVHYAAVGVWTGAVFVSGWVVLSPPHTQAFNHIVTNRYLALMSHFSVGAVAAIIATGVFSAWHRVGTTEHLLHSTYGAILLVKVVLVLLALALGGYNKLIGLPGVSRSPDGINLVRLVLKVETGVLLAALLAASWLTSLPPPAAM